MAGRCGAGMGCPRSRCSATGCCLHVSMASTNSKFVLVAPSPLSLPHVRRRVRRRVGRMHAHHASFLEQCSRWDGASESRPLLDQPSIQKRASGKASASSGASSKSVTGSRRRSSPSTAKTYNQVSPSGSVCIAVVTI